MFDWLSSSPGSHLDSEVQQSSVWPPCVFFFQVWKETLLPPFSSSIAFTNGAIWPLQPTGSSNTKSEVYVFEAPSTPFHRPQSEKIHKLQNDLWSTKLEELFIFSVSLLDGVELDL